MRGLVQSKLKCKRDKRKWKKGMVHFPRAGHNSGELKIWYSCPVFNRFKIISKSINSENSIKKSFKAGS